MDVDVEGDEHHPARRLVEPVHELRFAPGEKLAVAEAERFDQSARRAVRIGAQRPQRQAGRFVDRGETITQEEQGGRCTWRLPLPTGRVNLRTFSSWRYLPCCRKRARNSAVARPGRCSRTARPSNGERALRRVLGEPASGVPADRIRHQLRHRMPRRLLLERRRPGMVRPESCEEHRNRQDRRKECPGSPRERLRTHGAQQE